MPPPVPHKDFSGVYETMSGQGESASEAHRAPPVPRIRDVVKPTHSPETSCSVSQSERERERERERETERQRETERET